MRYGGGGTGWRAGAGMTVFVHNDGGNTDVGGELHTGEDLLVSIPPTFEGTVTITVIRAPVPSTGLRDAIRVQGTP